MNELRKIVRAVLNEAYVNVVYSAVVIEDISEEQKIKDIAKKYIPSGWREPVHYHMTISRKKLPDFLKERGDLGQTVDLTLTTIGISDKAIAFGTFGYYSKNDIPHITVAFNSDIGGIPADSKEIKNWQPINNVVVTGVVREIGDSNKVLKEKELEEMLGYKTMNTTTSRLAHPGIPGEFPQPGDFDQFGNKIQ